MARLYESEETFLKDRYCKLGDLNVLTILEKVSTFKHLGILFFPSVMDVTHYRTWNAGYVELPSAKLDSAISF